MNFETLTEYQDRIFFNRKCRQICADIYVVGFGVAAGFHYWGDWLTTNQYLLVALIATVLMVIKLIADVEAQDEFIDVLVEEEVS